MYCLWSILYLKMAISSTQKNKLNKQYKYGRFEEFS